MQKKTKKNVSKSSILLIRVTCCKLLPFILHSSSICLQTTFCLEHPYSQPPPSSSKTYSEWSLIQLWSRKFLSFPFYSKFPIFLFPPISPNIFIYLLHFNWLLIDRRLQQSNSASFFGPSSLPIISLGQIRQSVPFQRESPTLLLAQNISDKS